VQSEVFTATAKAKGIEIVDQQYTTDKATDFMAILTAIKSKNPDGIFFGGMDPQAGPIARKKPVAQPRVVANKTEDEAAKKAQDPADTILRPALVEASARQ
jgi:ABC-type branched-subunit amino acid transport system substrate-binding protein